MIATALLSAIWSKTDRDTSRRLGHPSAAVGPGASLHRGLNRAD